MNQDIDLNLTADTARKLTSNYKTTVIREVMDKIKSACFRGKSSIPYICPIKYKDDILKHLIDLGYHCTYEKDNILHISWA